MKSFYYPIDDFSFKGEVQMLPQSYFVKESDIFSQALSYIQLILGVLIFLYLIASLFLNLSLQYIRNFLSMTQFYASLDFLNVEVPYNLKIFLDSLKFSLAQSDFFLALSKPFDYFIDG